MTRYLPYHIAEATLKGKAAPQAAGEAHSLHDPEQGMKGRVWPPTVGIEGEAAVSTLALGRSTGAPAPVRTV